MTYMFIADNTDRLSGEECFLHIGVASDNRVFAAAGLRPFAEMSFVTAAAGAPAAPTGPFGPDGHLANTQNVIRYV